MADPYIGAPFIFFFVDTAPAPPEVTSPRTVVLYFEGFDGTGDYPIMKFIDDVGNISLIPLTGSIGDYSIAYYKDGVFYEFPFATDASLVDLFLAKGNLIFGNASDAIFEKGIVMWNGVDGGTVEVFAEANNDATQHRIELASADPTAEYQAVVATDLSGANHWAYVTADVCLAKGVSVDLNSTTKQTLYTVPASRSCIITKVVKRDASAAVTTAVGAFGFNANADDVVASFNVFDKLTGTTVYDISEPKVAAVKGSATNTFGYKGSVAEGATRTMVVDVFGYLL